MTKLFRFLSFIVIFGLAAAPVSLFAQRTPRNLPPDFVRIEAGIFVMGSPRMEVSRDRDETEHREAVATFYMATHEVTQREYEMIMSVNPSGFMGASLPVENVSWFDAILYCNARSVVEGLTPAYQMTDTDIMWDHTADGYRLPTEAEWEYACRAGTSTVFNSGNNLKTEWANFDGNYPYNKKPKGAYLKRTSPVMAYAPNDWGLYDMHGNVYEWCWDQYKPYQIGEDLDGSLNAPAIIRGGSWFSEARFLRAANRARSAHLNRANYIGFRVVRSTF
jgi:formylglycine-generating enzyme required for sulfatase activity